MSNVLPSSSRNDLFNKYLDAQHTNGPNQSSDPMAHFNINWASSEHMHVQALRIYSFVNWERQPSATRLARAGYYYDTEKENVICFSCGGIFHDWNKDLTVIEQHKLENRNCAFANGLDHRNIPLGPIENTTTIKVRNKNTTRNVENNSSQDPPLTNQIPLGPIENTTTIKVRNKNTTRNVENNSSQDPPLTNPIIVPQIIVVREPNHSVLPNGLFGLEPRYPEYRNMQARLDSYESWPTNREQTPKPMAAAGFFYAGITDCVRCFTCNGGLRNWLPGDDPWDEHRRWFPACAFIMATDNHLNYEQLMTGLTGAADAIDIPRSNVGMNQRPLSDVERYQQIMATNTSSSGSDVDQFMTSSIVRIAMDMGYSSEIIREVADNFYTKSCKVYTSATDLLDDIFRHEDQLENPGANSPTLVGVPQEQRPVMFISAPRPLPDHCLSGDSVRTPTKKSPTKKSPTKKSPTKKSPTKKSPTKKSINAEKKKSIDAEKKKSIDAEKKKLKSLADLDILLSDVHTIKIINKELKEARRCRVCWDQDICIVFLPCGHMCTCGDCAAALKDCPICRGYIRGTIKTLIV